MVATAAAELAVDGVLVEISKKAKPGIAVKMYKKSLWAVIQAADTAKTTCERLVLARSDVE